MDFPQTFELWLDRQRLTGVLLPADAEASLRRQYEADKARVAAHDASRWRRKPLSAGEYCYAVAIDDGQSKWVTMCVKRSLKGEYFVLYPRDGEWDPHASYHANGLYHQKSYGLKSGVQQRQPLDQFKGTEHLGSFMGHGKGLALYNPEAYTAALTVPDGVLEPMRGEVLVDLVESGHLPAPHHRQFPGMRILTEQTYKDASPWIVIAVARRD